MSRRIRSLRIVLVLLALALPRAAWAQTGAVVGRVTAADQRVPVGGAMLQVEGLSLLAVSQASGDYAMRGLAPGRHRIIARALGYAPRTFDVAIVAGDTVTLDIALEPAPIHLGQVIVLGASRMPERVVDAPAAIAVVDRAAASDLSITGQPPQALAQLPGVHVVQSGMHEFNVNARGFNSSLNRRMLVLQDGRDLAVPLLGFQEWGGLSQPLADLWNIEVVRGPGSALYGANAYTGVINIRTPLARDLVGIKATIAGGELGSRHADARWATVSRDDRYGYRVNVGYDQTDSWTRARTSADRGDLQREYAGITDAPVPEVMEAVPLFGQTLAPGTRAAQGEPDPERSVYGSMRFDHYANGGWVGTVEGGSALIENATVISGIGRIQIDRVLRPWARLAFNHERLSGMLSYSGRNTLDDPHRALSSGASIEDRSHSFHLEAQTNRTFARERGRYVIGGSLRNVRTDTEETLFAAPDDDRSDWSHAGFGQVEYHVTPRLHAVAALRYDQGSLYDAQLSPRAALVYELAGDHSLRLTVHRAFQTPTQLEQFLRVPAAQPANFSALEAGLRASSLGPALANVPDGQLFTDSRAVPVLGIGNADLEVETVRSFELGYRAEFGDAYVTIEGFYSRLANFVTDLMPGANPRYGPWTAPAEVPASARSTLEQTVVTQLRNAGQALAAAGLTRLADGNTAIVLSYANAGKATEQGVELSARVPITRGLDAQASYTYFDFSVDASSVLPGDQLKPNTPRHKATIGATYSGHNLELAASGVFVSAFDWSAGVFTGPVPARQTVDLRAGYFVLRRLRVHGVATNVFDQRRYQMYGGSPIGRRVLIGLTVAR